MMESNGSPRPLTALAVAKTVLANQLQGDTADGQRKFDRGQLLMRIYSAPENAEITVDEAGDLKRLVAIPYGPIVVMRFWNLIEGK